MKTEFDFQIIVVVPIDLYCGAQTFIRERTPFARQWLSAQPYVAVARFSYSALLLRFCKEDSSTFTLPSPLFDLHQCEAGLQSHHE